MISEDKRVDIRCMCLSFAIATCADKRDVLEVARGYENFVLGTRAKLRVVSNDTDGAA